MTTQTPAEQTAGTAPPGRFRRAGEPSRPSRPVRARREPEDRKPLMTTKAILLMNFGFFGIQYSFGFQQTAVNPIFGFIGADPATLPLLNLPAR